MYDPPARPPPPYTPFDMNRTAQPGQPAPALAIPGVTPQMQGAAPVHRANLPPGPPAGGQTDARASGYYAPPPQQQQQHQQQYAAAPPSGAAPPANYGARPPQAPAGSSRSAVRQGKEDPLELLRDYDTIFIIDDSGSMEVNEMPDGSIGPSRWEEARDALAGVVETAAKYDDDGVDVHFINDTRSIEGCRDPRQVFKLFADVKPSGATPTGGRLELLLLDYMDQIEAAAEQNKRNPGSAKGPKRRNFVIITDGAATDDPEDVIVACAQRLDRGNFPLAQIGIQFIQVGNDKDATDALIELDDVLSREYRIRDMVDMLPYHSMRLDSQLILKALMGGINRRMDRQAHAMPDGSERSSRARRG
ncbi:hypothetical protein MCUN1_002027 [Malassezia cuniculi]|uniref:VWFA domain-containing protein n=1 Tax=Malassezia cuniculi TaxID=948313 RepID=A0AAF0EV27_9BASI|nr:hypothetical protein MCUN1_002027 [Malassezia cuniculi]